MFQIIVTSLKFWRIAIFNPSFVFQKSNNPKFRWIIVSLPVKTYGSVWLKYGTVALNPLVSHEFPYFSMDISGLYPMFTTKNSPWCSSNILAKRSVLRSSASAEDVHFGTHWSWAFWGEKTWEMWKIWWTLQAVNSVYPNIWPLNSGKMMINSDQPSKNWRSSRQSHAGHPTIFAHTHESLSPTVKHGSLRDTFSWCKG